MLQTAAEDPHAGVLGVVDHGVRGLHHLRQLLLGHLQGALGERDQVLRHLTLPSGSHDQPV